MKTDPSAEGDAQQILDSIRRIVRELRVSARAAESAVGLSGAQLFVLSRLADEKRLSLGDLAARTLTDPSSVSVVVAKLASAGLVTRKRSAEDERRVELAITPAGRALLRRAPSAAQDRLIDAAFALGTAPRRTLARLLDELVRGMGIDDTEAHLFFEDERRAPSGGPPRATSGAGSRAQRGKAAPRPPAPRATSGAGSRAQRGKAAPRPPAPRAAPRKPSAVHDRRAAPRKPGAANDRRAAPPKPGAANDRRAASGGVARAAPRAHQDGRSQ